MLIEIRADLGGDREPWRHGEPEIAHLGQIRALAAKERAHLRASLGLAIPKTVNPLRHVTPVSVCLCLAGGVSSLNQIPIVSWPCLTGPPSRRASARRIT